MTPRCEDHPCCGHEEGGCPGPNGEIYCLECGAEIPKGSRSTALCNNCLFKEETD